MLTTQPRKVVLSGISCVTSSFCMAVGTEQVGAQVLALAEGWDGTQWRTLPTPVVSGSAVQAVSCTSTSFCFAAGTVDPPDTGRSSPTTRIIVEEWNGTSWSMVSYRIYLATTFLCRRLP